MIYRILTFFAALCIVSGAYARYNIVPAPAEMQIDASANPYIYKGAVKPKLVTDSSLRPEEYVLTVDSKGVVIKVADAKGFFYGKQTLAQMQKQSDGELPACTITDYPRFGYRGVMLDLVRCYLPVGEIKKIIDVAAELKLNTLHLHLTDDNGWRLEIKKYPKLTDVGAWRVDRPELFPGRLNARSASEPATYGGYYTQKEMRELVKYAAKKHITIIPEIEMPAHAAAAIASYPELACPVVDKFVGVFPGIGGKDAAIIMCAGNEDVYRFYEDVLDEVMDIFPSEYIHLGGDEAQKGNWEKCPKCNEKLHSEGLKDFEELQGYFMDRINKYVHQKGRKTIGWDEVTYGDPKEEMTIMGWQGLGNIAVNDSRSSGRPFIMTPAKKLYLIRYQGPQWFEPYTYFGNNTLKDVYMYEPVDSTWTSALENNLQGVQASLWTEFCKNADDVQYLIFPRLLALSEVAWSPKNTKDWQGFLDGADAFLPLLDKRGINYARSMYNLDHNVTRTEDGALRVEFSSIRPDLDIRYSVGDSTFSHPGNEVIVKDDAVVYATTFKDGERAGQMLQIPLSFNKATAAVVTSPNCSNGLAGVLTNGLRGQRNSDFEWAGWHNCTAEFVVDLGSKQDISEVNLGCLVNSDICIAAPKDLYLYTSDNGSNWQLVSTIANGADDIYIHPQRIVDYSFDGLDISARYLKVVAVNPGIIPDGYAREGTPSWLYFDEISVK